MSAPSAQLETEVQVSENARAPWWHFAGLCVLLFGLVFGLQLVRPGGHGILFPLRDHFVLFRLFEIAIDLTLISWVVIPVAAGAIPAGSVFGVRFLYFRQFKADIRWGLATCAATLLVYALARMVFGGRSPHNVPMFVIPSTLSELIAALFVGALLTAFLEELIFRGYLLNQIYSVSRNAVFANVIQAGLFALLHGPHQSFAGALDKFASGFIFAWVAMRRKSLFPAMVAHACTNALAYIAIYLLVRFA